MQKQTLEATRIFHKHFLVSYSVSDLSSIPSWAVFTQWKPIYTCNMQMQFSPFLASLAFILSALFV